jgi:hypothetical protein
MHIVNPTLARYVGGDPGREWELSASPLMPMMATGAIRGSISAFLAEGYNLLLPETTFAGAPPAGPTRPRRSSFVQGFLADADEPASAGRFAACPERNLEPGPALASSWATFARAAHARDAPLYAWHESHDFCLPVCAGSKLNMATVHPHRAALCAAGAGAPRGPNLAFWCRGGVCSRWCLPMAGPRSTTFWRQTITLGILGI